MGFKAGAWCTVFGMPESKTDMVTTARVSISVKNRQTGEYEQTFGGYVSFVGSSAAVKALRLKDRQRIRLNEVDVTSRYNKEKNVTYYNFSVFSFDTAEEFEEKRGSGHSTAPNYEDPTPSTVDNGEPEMSLGDDRLPF